MDQKARYTVRSRRLADVSTVKISITQQLEKPFPTWEDYRVYLECTLKQLLRRNVTVGDDAYVWYTCNGSEIHLGHVIALELEWQYTNTVEI